MATNFQIALKNVDFDNSYENSFRFNSRAEQEQYFDVVNSFTNAVPVNFRSGTLLRSRAVYRADNVSLINFMNYNYAIVKDNTQNATLPYLYYFITQVTFDTANQVILDLELDVIQTYYIDLEFSRCIINRAHLDRWTYVSNGQYKFNTSMSSPFYEREQVKTLSKYISKREKCIFKYETNSETGSNSISYENSISKWFNDNIQCWVYVYVIEGNYKFYTANKTLSETTKFYFKQYTNNTDTLFNAIYQPYSIIAFPIYKTNKRIHIHGKYTGAVQTDYTVEMEGFKFIRQINTDFDGFILNVKVSPLAPFPHKLYTIGTTSRTYNIDSNGNLHFNCAENSYEAPDNINYDIYGVMTTKALSTNYGVIGCFSQYLYGGIPIYNKPSVNGLSNTFSSLDIENYGNRYYYNPKIYSFDFYDLTITNGINRYKYDMLKLASRNYIDTEMPFTYYESFAPDVTRTFTAFRNVEDISFPAIYSNTEKAMVGNFGLLDLSMPFSKNQLDVFLANNKNFYLQRNINTANDAVNSITNVAVGALQMSYGAKIKGSKGIKEGITGAKDTVIDRIQSNLTLDNMNNAPADVYNMSGNSALYSAISNCDLYFEYNEALNFEIISVNDIMHLNGFTYGRLDNIKYLDNIRKHFNYIEANVENVYASYGISTEVRDKIKEIFGRGIRLWNYYHDTHFDFTASNYERYLDE